MSTPGIRLPRTARPTHYYVELTPDLKAHTFIGSVNVTLDILRPTKQITCHAKELEVTGFLYISNRDCCMAAPKRISYDRKNDRVKFVFSEVIMPGKATLCLKFKGTLNDQMSGFYRSTYEVNGEKRTMAVTQFEDTEARRAFPCWDEPDIKAAFQFVFNIERGLEVVSNMPVEREHSWDFGQKRVVFKTTPIMSTYLAAFAVGEFERISVTTKEGTLVSVLTTPGKKDEGTFALEVGVKALEFYNDYFGIPYPLPKLDMLAVPDFAAGAMENWGLVTYRETALLVNEQLSSAARKQRVAIVVAHELAHQWFGNLVTMVWWTQLWLNEGFATWMEYFAVDHIFPEWKIWDQFTAGDMCSALSADGLRTTHAIEVEIKHPSEIGQNFDQISYEKGAAIIRMIHTYIGAESFRDGLCLYLKRHAYGNAVTEDLWEAFEEVSGKPVREIMNSWTKQKGYPLITVTPHPSKLMALVFSQKRFLSSGEALLPEEADQRWHVALSCATGSGKKKSILFSETSTEAALGISCVDQWFKCNFGQSTFVRVKYPTLLLGRLASAVRRQELASDDRLGLVSDLLATVRAGETPVTQLLNFLKSFGGEKEYVVWREVLGAIGKIYALIPAEQVLMRLSFSSIVCNQLIDKAVELVGWEEQEGETHSQKLLRPIILEAAVLYEHEGVTEEARRRFGKFFNEKSPLNPNLRWLVFSTVAKTGGWAEFEALTKCYRGTDRQEERNQFLAALARFKDEQIIERALKFSFSDEVRPQDYEMFTSSIDSASNARRQWEFIKKHWDEFYNRYESSIMLLSRTIESLIDGMETNEDLADVEEFLKQHPVPRATQAVSQSMERVRSWIAWRERDQKNVISWIKDFA